MYEHQQEAQSVVADGLQIFGLVTDAIPDQTQITQITLSALKGVNDTLGAVGAEDKPAYKAKFLAVVLVIALKKVIPQMGLPAKNAAVLIELVKAAQAVLNIELPDSES